MQGNGDVLRTQRVILMDAEGVERAVLGIEQGDGGRCEVVLRDLHADAGEDVRFRHPLWPTLPEREAQEARAAVHAGRQLALRVLVRAESGVRHAMPHIGNGLTYGGMIPSSGTALREALPALAAAVDALRERVALDPWPEGEERLRQAEGLQAEATALLAEFDQRLAEREARRSGAAR